jgi:hypothetical protein
MGVAVSSSWLSSTFGFSKKKEKQKEKDKQKQAEQAQPDLMSMDNVQIESAPAAAAVTADSDLLSMDNADQLDDLDEDADGQDEDDGDDGEASGSPPKEGQTGRISVAHAERRRKRREQQQEKDQQRKQRRDEAVAVGRLDALRKLQHDAAAARQRYETARFDLVWLLNQVECRKWHRLVRSVRALLEAQREFAARVFDSAAKLPAVLQNLDWQLDTTAKAFATEMRLWRAQRIALVGQLQSSTDTFSNQSQLTELQNETEATVASQSGEQNNKQQLESSEEKGEEKGGEKEGEKGKENDKVKDEVKDEVKDDGKDDGKETRADVISVASAASLHPLEAVSAPGVFVLSTKTLCRELYLQKKMEGSDEAGKGADGDTKEESEAVAPVFGANSIRLGNVSMSSVGALCHALQPEAEIPFADAPPASTEAKGSGVDESEAQAAGGELPPQPQIIRSVTRQGEGEETDGREETPEAERMQDAMLAHNKRVMQVKQRVQREKEQEQRLFKKFDASLEVLATSGHEMGLPILQGFLWEKQESLMQQMSIAGSSSTHALIPAASYLLLHTCCFISAASYLLLHAFTLILIHCRYQQVAKGVVQSARRSAPPL